MTPIEIWEYYRKAAKRFLIGEPMTGEDGSASEKWSRATYFPGLGEFVLGHSYRTLNRLTKAMLGDERVRSGLGQEFVKDDDLKVRIDGMFPQGMPCWDPKKRPKEDQELAIMTALAQPVSFIKGPPGTGKTEVILNILNCIAKMNMDGDRTTALVTSVNNAAIENVEDKLYDYNTDENAEENDVRLYLKEHFARLGKDGKRNSFVLGLSPADYEALKKTDAQERRTQTQNSKLVFPISLSDADAERKNNFIDRFPIVSCTIHSMRSCVQYGFDYIIMDESSQVNILLGLIPMLSARHLVIVGDTDQLPPVGGDIYTEIRESCGEIDSGYDVLTDNNEPRSFLEMCKDIFVQAAPGGVTLERMLKKHYRCHPNIIGFCNEEIYDGLLDLGPVTTERNKLTCPIKVLWYNGNYCERCLYGTPEENKEKPADERNRKHTRRNRKQLEIFTREELPALIERMKTNEIRHACILSPYRGQLSELEELVRSINDELKEHEQLTANSISICGGSDGANTPNAVEILSPETQRRLKNKKNEPPFNADTIFRSQGKEYDIVYLMPVEDNTDINWPWSQNRNMINVAVSRAKKELHIITSSLLMEQRVKDALGGSRTDSVTLGGSNVLFTQKLITYAAKSSVC